MIKYLDRKEIDSEKWDKCILDSCNYHVYALSEYLDIFCEHWGGLVLDDYEAVMPLPYKKKYELIYYIYTPIGIQQLGIFAQKQISEHFINLFIRHIPKKFLLVNTTLNFANSTKSLKNKPNYILALDNEFQKKYSKNTNRNLSKAISEKLIAEQISSVYAIALFRDYMSEQNKSLNELFFNNLQKLVVETNNFLEIESYAVFNTRSKILSIGIFLKIKKRLVYMGGTTKESEKSKGAGHFLIDYVANIYAQKGDYILDFEGSTIEGVAHFYRGFGAQLQPYYHYKNWLAKLLS